MGLYNQILISKYQDEIFYFLLVYDIIFEKYFIIDIDTEISILKIISEDNSIKAQIIFEQLIRYLNGFT